MKAIDITNLIFNGFQTNGKGLYLTNIENFLPLINKEIRTYTSFIEIFPETFSKIIKFIEIDDDLFFLTEDGKFYLNNELKFNNVIDFINFDKYFIFLFGNNLKITQDFVSINDVNLPNGFVATNLASDNWRVIAYNKFSGLTWFSGFKDPNNWNENQAGETLNAFYHDFKEEIIDIIPILNELFIITKNSIYRKIGDYPYEIKSYNKGERNIYKAFKFNNNIFLFGDNVSTLTTTQKYGDFEEVAFLDGIITNYHLHCGFAEKITKFYRGFIVNDILYYDVYLGKWFKFNIGNHLYKDYWQIDGKICKYSIDPINIRKRAILSTNTLYLSRNIIRRIISKVKAINNTKIDLVVNERLRIPLTFTIVEDIVGYDFDIVGYDDDPLSTSIASQSDRFVRVFTNKNFSIKLVVNDGGAQFEYINIYVDPN